MEKRLPLALFLSFLVLFAWTLFVGEPPEDEPPGAPAGGPAAAAGVDPSDPAVSSGESADSAEADSSGEDEADAGVARIADTEERTLVLDVGPPVEAGAALPVGAYRAVFTNRGAALRELSFRTFYKEVGLDAEKRRDPANWLPLLESVQTLDGRTGSLLLRTSPSSAELAPRGLDDVLWQMTELEDGAGARFRYGPGNGLVFEKTITFVPGTWEIRLDLRIENEGDVPSSRRQFVLVPAACVPPELGDNFYPEPRAVGIGRLPKGGYEIEGEAAPVDEVEGLDVPALVLAGVHAKYFACTLREEGDTVSLTGASYRPVQELRREGPRDLLETEVQVQLQIPARGEASEYEYLVYAGPKDPEPFVGDFEGHALILEDDLSTFSSIGKLLLSILRFMHGLVGNWGVAIILLTLCVRLVLFPLNRRSQTAMARYQTKMKRVQPKLEEVKKRYADDPQKLRENQARIMQEEKAFPPLGGCLPMFLQLPIFFGLFSALRTSFDLRQAPFYGWITDLSQPDRLLRLDIRLPGFLPDITWLNLLPILMVILWILQQRGMPKPTDEQAARMQKMMAFMPVLFGFMLYNYAAGLSLYMITTSTFGIIEQKVIKKVWPIDDTEVVSKKEPKGCGPFSGVMENLAEKQKEQMKRMQAMQRERERQANRRKKKRR